MAWFLAWIIMLHGGCVSQLPPETPLFKSFAILQVTASSFTTAGVISQDGGAKVVARGICWSARQNATIVYRDSITSDGTGTGSFNSTVSRIKPGASYFVRAYATNSAGTAYSNELVVSAAPVLPVLSTALVTAINSKVFNSGGNITYDGGAPVFARGVCWSTSPNPTTANYSTSDGKGTGSFVSAITGFSTDSLYYLRAYATNSQGTGYGPSRFFSPKNLVVSDKDGNFYNYVNIGSQIWMSENLKTTRFRDSTLIPLLENGSTWSTMTTPAFCWYENDGTNKNIYGGLYNWPAVSSGKLCPTGWHVPTNAEWMTMINYLGGESLAGGKLKEKSDMFWKMPNYGATNESLFTGLPGGSRTNTGLFENAGSYGYWWSATPVTPSVSNYCYLYFGNRTITDSFINQRYGLSVRCVKN